MTAFQMSKKEPQGFRCEALLRAAHLADQQGGIIRLPTAAPLWLDQPCTNEYHWCANGGEKIIKEGTG